MIQNISVIVPAYNRVNTLVRVIDSILSQTVPVTEVIVVDDGSVDATPEVMARLTAERPDWAERVRYIRQENQGQSEALNRGIAEARGEWLGFSGHDDLWLPWKLEWQGLALEKYNGRCGVCFTDAWFMNNPHMKRTVFQQAGFEPLNSPLNILERPADLVTKNNPVWAQTALVRADLAKKVGCFDSRLRYSEDHDFVFKMAITTEFCCVDLPLVLIDRSPADIRHTGAAEDWHRREYCLQMDQLRFENQFAAIDGVSLGAQENIRRNLRCIHSYWATLHLADGDTRAARASLRTALEYQWSFTTGTKLGLITLVPALARIVFRLWDRNGGVRVDRNSWQQGKSVRV